MGLISSETGHYATTLPIKDSPNRAQQKNEGHFPIANVFFFFEFRSEDPASL